MQIIKPFLELTTSRLLPYHNSFQKFADKHYGKILAICIDDMDITLYSAIHKTGMCLVNDNKSDAEIHLNVPAILRYMGFHHPKASIRIEGDQAFGMAASRQLSLNQIHLKNMLSDATSPRIGVLIEEILHQIKQLAKYSSSELKTQLKDFLINDLGICLDRSSSDQTLEQTMRLQWLLDELKSSLNQIKPS